MTSTTSLGGPSTIVSYCSSSPQFRVSGLRLRFDYKGSGRRTSRRRFRVHCESTIQEKELRRCSPILERSSSPGDAAALRSNEWKSVPDIWRSSSEKYGDRIAVMDPYHEPPSIFSYRELEQEILDFVEGLRVIGVKADEKIALFADNSCRWLVADQGIMATGAVNVVRGFRSSVEELLQIYCHSESVALVVDNLEFFNRIAETFSYKAPPRFVILLWGDKSSLVTVGRQTTVYSYNEIKNFGQERRANSAGSNDAGKYEYEFINPDDRATIMYTSGTTGNPKGVMLTHKNWLHQIINLYEFVPAETGERFLSMLPSWHAYERACDYFFYMWS